MLNYLDGIEEKTIYVLREGYSRFKKIALLWSIGKDSTALVWIARKAFFGKIPFPIVHIDTTFKFKEMYDFREEYKRKWNMDLIVSRNEKAVEQKMCPGDGKLECCTALKTEALKITLKERGFRALFLGIRRDEHGIRAKERYFSPRDTEFGWNYRNQPAELWDLYKSNTDVGGHFRIHPMLHWTELDIWRYIQREGIPINSLYFVKNRKRYRSIGCKTCCASVKSGARNVKEIIKELEKTRVAERSGRAQDKEDVYAMQKLRSLGYM